MPVHMNLLVAHFQASNEEKPTFSLLEFRESTESASGLEKRGRGRFLWHRQYIEWAQGTDGGRKTIEQAEATWAQMCANLSFGASQSVHITPRLSVLSAVLSHNAKIQCASACLRWAKSHGASACLVIGNLYH